MALFSSPELSQPLVFRTTCLPRNQLDCSSVYRLAERPNLLRLDTGSAPLLDAGAPSERSLSRLTGRPAS